ncbi:MAG: hypothetical protein K0U98_04870 [Deltaproteobacteria bacterium]|nr:hypothetical protein [Deltaproteobacteria bacterium]
MALEDFTGNYRIEAVERAMKDYETLKHPLRVETDGFQPTVTCLDAGHSGLYQGVTYDEEKDVLRGKFSGSTQTSFTIEVVVPNKEISCILGGDTDTTIPGSWTAEDPNPNPNES